MYQNLLALEENIFKVIANQKRLEIIQLLHGRELNVTEMADMLGLRQPNLSQHLSLLRQNHLITATKQGRAIYYKLTDPTIAKTVQLVYQFLQREYGTAMSLPADKLFPIVVDPVCGMRLSASEAFSSTKRAGQTYYFCASGCESKFMTANRSARQETAHVHQSAQA